MESIDKSLCSSKVFEEVYKTHVKTLRNHIYYKCGDIDLAEDIVQDSFMKIWDNCANIILNTVKPLLYKMTTNAFLNIVTRKKIILKHEKLNPQIDTTIESPEFILEEKEFLTKLQKAISNLPEKERVVFLLNRIDKKKYREIADILEISIKTVEKRMSGALKILRKHIEGI